MKKLVLICLSTLLLSACADKENYEKAVLEQIKSDQDAKDYKADPEQVAKCIVDSTSKQMPGVVPFDPIRRAAYRNYTRMLTLAKAKDPKKVMAQLRTDFGSAKGLSDAHSNYAESTVDCISTVVMGGDKK